MTNTDDVTHLRALLADEHAKRCAAELDHAGAVALLAEQTARAERAEADYRRVLSERAAANQLAGRCAQQRDHALAACAEMRAALEITTEHCRLWQGDAGAVADLAEWKTRAEKAEAELAVWADKDGNSPGYNYQKARTYGAIAYDEREARKKAEAACAEMRAALEHWTHVYGAALKPPGADTYGEGKRDAKDEVATILRRMG